MTFPRPKFDLVKRRWPEITLVCLIFAFMLLLAFNRRWESIPATAFSGATALFAYYAYRFSADRFRLDLLDRRWSIYENILEFCSRVIQHGPLRLDDASREQTLKTIGAAEQSFRGTGWHKSNALFGPDVIAKLEELNKSFSWLSVRNQAPEDVTERQKWEKEWISHIEFIFTTANALPDIFKPYVYFGDYRKELADYQELSSTWGGPVFMCQDNRKPRSGSPSRVSPWRMLTTLSHLMTGQQSG